MGAQLTAVGAVGPVGGAVIAEVHRLRGAVIFIRVLALFCNAKSNTIGKEERGVVRGGGGGGGGAEQLTDSQMIVHSELCWVPSANKWFPLSKPLVGRNIDGFTLRAPPVDRVSYLPS